MDRYKENKKQGRSRREFLEQAAEIEGIYVPAFYDVEYHEDGTIKSFRPNNSHAKETITKQLVVNMDDAYYIETPVVPFIKATQDRVVLEIQRGLHPRMPFLPGRNDLPSHKREERGAP